EAARLAAEVAAVTERRFPQGRGATPRPTLETKLAAVAYERPLGLAQMTRTTNARIAGFTLLLYIAAGITQMIVSGRASRGEGIAARLASMAQHATDVRIAVLLGLLTCFVALTLGVALYAITREEDPDLAMLALMCRVAEGVAGAFFIPMTLALLSLATEAGANPPDAAAQSLASFFLTARRWNPIIAATFFAVGSTLFSWLLLRGRMIPAALAWLGVLGSILPAVCFPLQLAGLLGGRVT